MCGPRQDSCLRVEFLLKTDSGYPKDTGFTLATPGNPLCYNTHQSAPPVSALTHSRGGRGPSHQSHVLKHRYTYGQAQVCSKGHQGSSVDRPCQPSFHWSKFWHLLGHCGSRGYSRRPRCFWRILHCDKCANDKNRHRHLLLVFVRSHTFYF